MVKFGGDENLLDVLTEYINFGCFSFIAAIYTLAEVWAA
jgi:uncharacterized protein YutD